MAQKNSQSRKMLLAGKRSKCQAAVAEFMAKFPKMTYAEIRRHRIDYFKALCFELEEDGHTDASKEIQRLIDLEESQRRAAEQNSIILAKPFLKDQHTMLDVLQKGLRQAEKEKVSGHPERVCTVFLNLAIYFEEKGANWYHIADEFFKKSCEIGKTYIIDGGRIASIANFSYGKFLMEKMKNEKKAISVLETVQNTSIGKLWLLPNLEPIDITKDGETAQDDIWASELKAKAAEAGTIHEETCTLLNKIYFKMVKNLRNQGQSSNLDDAIELCSKALKNARKSGKVHLRAEALKELGLCHMEKEDFHSAQSYFEELLRFSSQNGLKTAVCEAHQQLGHIHERSKDPIKALYHFENFCKAANNFETIHLSGRSYRCLGAFHLLQGNNEEATECLQKAFNQCKLFTPKDKADTSEAVPKTHKGPSSSTKSQTSFCKPLNEGNKNLIHKEAKEELERTIIFTAIAKGLKHLPLYAKLIMNSSDDKECMKALMQWRDDGEPFWDTSLAQQLTMISSKPELDIPVPSPNPPSVISSDFPSDFPSDYDYMSED